MVRYRTFQLSRELAELGREAAVRGLHVREAALPALGRAEDLAEELVLLDELLVWALALRLGGLEGDGHVLRGLALREALARRRHARQRPRLRPALVERFDIEPYSDFPAKLFKLDRARSRLYRGQILQENMRLKALAEIYTKHSFAHPLHSSAISFFCQKFANNLIFSQNLANI